MVAGREFDALIAEKVMGLLGVHLDPFDGEPLYRKMPNPLGWSFVPQYSTSIQDAWMVVEKLRVMLRKDFQITLYVSPDDEAHRYEVAITPKSGPATVEQGETMPLAICLAALHAVQP